MMLTREQIKAIRLMGLNGWCARSGEHPGQVLATLCDLALAGLEAQPAAAPLAPGLLKKAKEIFAQKEFDGYAAMALFDSMRDANLCVAELRALAEKEGGR